MGERAVAKSSLEKRVADLEAQVADIRTLLAHLDEPKDWRRTVGMFSDNEGMQQLFKEAMKLREADRAKARRRYARQKQTRS
jgi:hypothetical protein